MFLLPLGIMAQSPKAYIPISVSYFGNLGTHPGIKLEAEKVWEHSNLVKTTEKRTKLVRNEIFSGVSVAGYSHPGTHVGIISGINIGGRVLRGSGWFGEANLGANYYAILNQGDTWELDENGNAVNLGGTSRGYISPSFSFGGGKVFQVKEYLAMGFFVRANAHYLVGYNTTMLPHPSLELGIRLLPGITFPFFLTPSHPQ